MAPADNVTVGILGDCILVLYVLSANTLLI
jgi:hypothetical protein